MPCPLSAGARSSIPATALWLASSHQQGPFDAQFRFNANWTSTGKQAQNARSRSELALQQANPSSNITISLDRRFNWPPAYALTHNQNKSWYQTRSPSYALARDSCLKTWAKLPSKALVTPCALMPLLGSTELHRFNLQLIADFWGRILVRPHRTSPCLYRLKRSE